MSLIPSSTGYLDVSGTSSSQDVTAYVCNIHTGDHGEYTGFTFNSLAKIGGKYYGCKAGAVYELTGATDAGTAIEAFALSGIVEVKDAEMKQKACDNLYYNLRAYDRPLDAVVRVDEDTTRYYPITPFLNGGIGTSRAKVAKGLEGRNWQFGVRNNHGSRFDVNTYEPRLSILKRNVSR